MSSRSGSESGSDRSSRSRSGSPILNHGPAPTPGHSLEQKSPPNSPNNVYSKSQRSRSQSEESNKSVGSDNSGPNKRKSRSRSVQSNRSRSQSGGSNRSGSANSKDASQTSRSNRNTRQSGSDRSRSGSASSKASGRSKTPNRSRSASAGSKRSGSAGSRRSGSAASKRSRSSGSNRSQSGSRSSRSASAESKNSGKSAKSRSRSRSNTPDLEIDEGPIEKRKLSEDEEDEGNQRVQKKKRVIDSDSEPEEAGKEVSAAAIFGDDADDISSEDEKEKKSPEKDEDEREKQHQSEDDQPKSDSEAQKGEDNEEEKENEPEPIPETRIDVEIPKISCDLGRDIHFVKLPNFLSVETRPFDPETYEDEIDEEETLDEEGRARLKLKVENTIRWRDVMDDDGNFKKESNARMVRWSDGSYSLHLGSEIFDVYKQPLQGDHNHLFIRQGTGLQGQAVFRTKLSFRPHSTESFTHRKMTLSLADRSQKTTGIKILSQVGVDPEQDRYLRLKKEEDKLRQASRTSKPRTKRDSARLNARGGEEDGSDDEGAISLNAIKNKYKQQAQNKVSSAIYSSDEEGSDIEMKSKKHGKTANIEESEESE